MNQFLREFWVSVAPIVLTTAVGIVTAAIAYVASAFKKWLDAKAAGDKKVAVLRDIYEKGMNAVAEVEATLRPQFGKALEDGELSQEEARTLKSEALRLLKGQFDGKTFGELEGLLGLGGQQLDVFLSGLLERCLNRLQTNRAIANGTASQQVTLLAQPAAVVPVVASSP